MTLRWLSLPALVCCAVATAQDSATAAVEECVAQIERSEGEFSRGFSAIQRGCPELKTVLEHSPIASWLPEGWWGPRLSTESLRELRDHAALESTHRELRTLDTSGVAAALVSLDHDAQSTQVSWWDRLREWLRKRLQGDSQQPRTRLFEWLDELTRHEAALRIIGYCLFALIILSAALIALNELRAAGVLGARWQRQWRAAASIALAGRAQALTLTDVERSAPVNRPSMLLELLMAALARRGGRAVDVSVTHRELAARVDLDDESQRLAFGRLLRCAERVRYAGALPTGAEIDEAVSGGRRLLESITAPLGTSAA